MDRTESAGSPDCCYAHFQRVDVVELQRRGGAAGAAHTFIVGPDVLLQVVGSSRRKRASTKTRLPSGSLMSFFGCTQPTWNGLNGKVVRLDDGRATLAKCPRLECTRDTYGCRSNGTRCFSARWRSPMAGRLSLCVSTFLPSGGS